MAENLKKFFKKKKLEIKFKKAGPGQRLNENVPKLVAQSSEPGHSRVEPSAEAKQAAAAALARLQGTSTPSGFNSRTDYGSLYKDMKKVVLEEMSPSDTESSPKSKDNLVKTETKNVDMSKYAADGVYFRCPLLGPEILLKSEWREKIDEYLEEQLKIEKGLAACLIIKNCNNNSEKINECVTTLGKYLQNIINNPDEDKYRKIRISNKVFQEKVVAVKGSILFLEAAGFIKNKLPVSDGEEEFFVCPSDTDVEVLMMLLDALENAEKIGLELDRNVQVLQPSQAAKRTELPSGFFKYTAEELKKEQQSKSESIEEMLTLRTKAMREKTGMKEMKRRYRYGLIRIRFPDGIFLQGTFSVHEKYADVIEFVKENLSSNCDFTLLTELGRSFSPAEHEKTLLDLRLVPATVLIFKPKIPPTDEQEISYIKPDVLILLQAL